MRSVAEDAHGALLAKFFNPTGFSRDDEEKLARREPFLFNPFGSVVRAVAVAVVVAGGRSAVTPPPSPDPPPAADADCPIDALRLAFADENQPDVRFNLVLVVVVVARGGRTGREVGAFVVAIVAALICSRADQLLITSNLRRYRAQARRRRERGGGPKPRRVSRSASGSHAFSNRSVLSPFRPPPVD